jgi:hypothetical protein
MDQARKALYCLYRKLRNISIPIDLQLKLFDTLIFPILTYGCEIWGYENTINWTLSIILKLSIMLYKIQLSFFWFIPKIYNP